MNQTTTIKMPLDPVHDLQRAFRKLVRALSFPGRLVDLGLEAGKIDLEFGLPRGLLVIAWMLLDSETSFYCADPSASKNLALLSFCRGAAIDEARFLFCDGQGQDFLKLLEQASVGSLIDPHESATIIARGDFDEASPLYSLTGPGIADKSLINIGLCPGWLEIRNRRNQEFPLGMDLIIVDHANRAIALPRSTKIIPGGA